METPPDYQISLAQGSLHRTYFGGPPDWQEFGNLLETDPDAKLKGDRDPFDFPGHAAANGIKATRALLEKVFAEI